MKISDLVKKLETLQLQFGDIDVYAYPYDGQEFPAKISSVSFLSQQGNTYFASRPNDPRMVSSGVLVSNS